MVTSLRYVWFWPNGGPRDGLWDEERSPGVDRFARTSRRVTERYSDELRNHEVPATRASLAILAFAAQRATSDVVVDVSARQFDGNEAVRVEVPEQVADLSGAERALLVLDVVSAAMNTLAGLRGWPGSPLEQARQHVLDHHFSFDVAGPWKSNRARTLRARPVLRVNDDGWGEKAFEVADAQGASLGFTAGESTPVNSEPKFKRDVRTWRWADASTLECPVGWQVRSAAQWGAVVRFDASDLRAWEPAHEPMPDRSPLPVVVRVT